MASEIHVCGGSWCSSGRGAPLLGSRRPRAESLDGVRRDLSGCVGQLRRTGTAHAHTEEPVAVQVRLCLTTSSSMVECNFGLNLQ